MTAQSNSAQVPTDRNRPLHSGLKCLAFIAQFHRIPATYTSLLHEHGTAKAEHSDYEIARAAKSSKLKAKIKKLTPSLDGLEKLPKPAMLKCCDGKWVVFGGVKEKGLLILNPDNSQPEVVQFENFSKDWSGTVILLARKSCIPESLQQFNISWFIPSLKKYKKLFGEVLLASFFIQLFGLVTPLFFQVVVDKVLVHKGITTLDVIAIGFLGISIFEVVLGGLRTWLFSHTAYRADVVLGARLFNHLIKLPASYFNSRRVGDSVARIRELETIRRFLTGSSLTLVMDLFFTVIFFFVMYSYSPLLTGVVAGIIPFYIILSAIVTPLLRKLLDEKFLRGAENQAFLVESITGIQAVKSMAVEPQFQNNWEEKLAIYVRSAFKADNLGNITVQLTQFLSKLTTLLIIWVGAHSVISNTISVGQLVAFNMMAGRITAPILRLAQLWQDFQQAGISLKRLGDILNIPTEECGKSSYIPPEIQGSVRFDNVSFRYRGDTPFVLKKLNLKVKKNESIGIVGRSGSGKSTLTNLLQRLHLPEEGRIFVDGHDINHVNTSWLRRQIGVVLQENILFNRTVYENIALCDPAAPIQHVIQAAKLAGAHEFIGTLPEGYETVVGEQGCTLSGGQRQRIAIARALLTKPRILILDEATSALDYESEHIIQKNMNAIGHGRTVFVIAHRLSTVMNCDRVIVIDKGNIIEEGTHTSLLQSGGYYAKLWAYQSSNHNDQRQVQEVVNA
ncbi:type I secretion system permease/ATPase [Halodesulfovibrio sp.]|jgi:subfamily B ATP-binding cassette protein HlyB/CyaB|uniref:type I secretion system permease/ATPase n=1 Tax=Halodesulfovibrio sp. TaxID=1912772 RepID=UPI0025D9660B|nr:type I secretion system permease/ATPase [Halodesulfovibrio sp.]MCT4627900.1 type I secretion system permease/ATPase [Halodesulfovibrio sp.]